MVKIPTRESQGQLSTRTASAPIQDIGTFTQTSAAIERAGQVIGQVADEFKRLETLRQTTSAQINTNSQLNELEQKFLEDPNLSQTSAPSYQAEAEKIVNNQLATIADEETRLRLGVQLQGQALEKSFNVKRQGRQNDIDTAVVQTDTLVNQYLNNSFQAGPAGRVIIEKNLEAHLEDNVAAGLFSRQAASKILGDFKEGVRKGRAQFMFDALTAPGEGKSEKARILGAQLFMEQIQSGEYSELTPQEEQTLINDAKNFITRQTEIDRIETEQEQRTNEKRDAAAIVDGSITLETVSRETIVNQTYSEAFFASVKRHNNDFKAPVEDGKTNIAVYTQLLKEGAGIIKKPDGSDYSEQEYIQRVVDMTNGNLSINDAKQLINKGFDRIGKGEASIFTRELKNLDNRIRIEMLRDYDESNIDLGIQRINATVNKYEYIFDTRVSAIENPTEEQLIKISDEVFNEWRGSPVEDGGRGLTMPPDKQVEIQMGVGGSIKRLLGVDDSKIKVDVNLTPQNKK